MIAIVLPLCTISVVCLFWDIVPTLKRIADALERKDK